MDEWLEIPQAAQLLNTTEVKARVLLAHWPVNTRDGLPSRTDSRGNRFGSAPKEYFKADVLKIAAFSLS